MLHSRILIWLEFVLLVIPTTLGAGLLLLGTVSNLIDPIFEPSHQDVLLWLVPVGTVFGIAALWMMFFGIVKGRPISRLVTYGFIAGIGVIFFTVLSGFDPRFSPWWTLPIRFLLNFGLPYMLVGLHWLYLLEKYRDSKREMTNRSGSDESVD